MPLNRLSQSILNPLDRFADGIAQKMNGLSGKSRWLQFVRRHLEKRSGATKEFFG